MGTNAIDCMLRATGQQVWEVQIMSEVAGDTPLDTNIQTTKDHRVYGIFAYATKELFQQLGFSLEADAVYFNREQLDMTSQLRYLDVLYEIREEKVIDPLHTGLGYAYILTKFPEKT